MKKNLDKNIKCQTCVITLRSTEITCAQHRMCFWIFKGVTSFGLDSQWLIKLIGCNWLFLHKYWLFIGINNTMTYGEIQKHMQYCANVISVDLNVMMQIWHLIFLSRQIFINEFSWSLNFQKHCWTIWKDIW